MSINNLTDITASQFAVFAYLQLVGVNVIYTVAALQISTKISKSTTEDGNLITAGLEDIHQSINPLSNGQVLGNVLHNADIQAFKQSHTTGETLFEIYFATHGTLGDGTNFSTDTVALS